MRLQDLNWMDVESYLQHDTRIILVTGATEQHAYLSLMTDILIPTRIAEDVAQREQVLVAPSLNFGISYLFGEFPGTISLSRTTFDHVVLEIVESLFHQGFRSFFIINGHGGNQLPERLQDFQRAGAIQVMWYDWWTGNAAQTFARQHSLEIRHANWGENFPFNRVADLPTGSKPETGVSRMEERYTARQVLGDGSFGGPYQVDDSLMMALFEAVVDEAAAELRALASQDDQAQV